jgi:hypothetical protein
LKVTEIIYSALEKSGIEMPELPLEKTEGNCMMCGKYIEEGIKYKKVVSGNFTDYDVFANIQGTHICKECATCVKTRELRVNSFIADSKHLYLLKKNDLEEYLFNLEKYVDGEFVVGITQSFKKHNSFRCKVNTNPKCFFIREEDREYLFDVHKLKPVYEKLNEAYLQFSKDEILTGNYKMISVEQFGINKFIEYEKLFKQYRGSAQFDIMLYMLNSEKRNEYVNAKMEEEKKRKKELEKLAKEEKKKSKKKNKEEINGTQISLF